MKVYRGVWVTICATLTTAGFSLGLVFVPVPMTILAIFFGAVAAIASWVWLLQNEDERAQPRAHSRVMVTNALTVGAVIGAAFGFAVLLGMGALLLLLVSLAVSPHALRAYSQWLVSIPTPQMDTMARALGYASPEYLTFQPPSELEALTDEELCRSWRASYTALQQSSSATQLAATVAERQTYLDELERRNSRGFAAWLGSEARAPGNPLPYLTPDGAAQPAINWDELTRGQDW